ncbi:MAG: Sua5 family C-terminal domain-containing protein [Myxococcota bacterium]
MLVDERETARTLSDGDGLLRLPARPEAAAAILYAELRRLDADPQVERIVVVRPPAEPAWHAIHDRLRRAAHAEAAHPEEDRCSS